MASPRDACDGPPSPAIGGFSVLASSPTQVPAWQPASRPTTPKTRLAGWVRPATTGMAARVCRPEPCGRSWDGSIAPQRWPIEAVRCSLALQRVPTPPCGDALPRSARSASETAGPDAWERASSSATRRCAARSSRPPPRDVRAGTPAAAPCAPRPASWLAIPTTPSTGGCGVAATRWIRWPACDWQTASKRGAESDPQPLAAVSRGCATRRATYSSTTHAPLMPSGLEAQAIHAIQAIQTLTRAPIRSSPVASWTQRIPAFVRRRSLDSSSRTVPRCTRAFAHPSDAFLRTAPGIRWASGCSVRSPDRRSSRLGTSRGTDGGLGSARRGR